MLKRVRIFQRRRKGNRLVFHSIAVLVFLKTILHQTHRISRGKRVRSKYNPNFNSGWSNFGEARRDRPRRHQPSAFSSPVLNPSKREDSIHIKARPPSSIWQVLRRESPSSSLQNFVPAND